MTGTRFFLLNAIGGIAVLGSYAWGLGLFPELRDAMWGGVPEHWRGLYTVNMFFAAAGYLIAFGYWLSASDATTRRSLVLPYSLILWPSALWMPLTVAVLETGIDLVWWLTWLNLALVAVGGLWVWFALFRHTTQAPWFRALAALFFSFFVLQTALLDGVIWPLNFVRP